MSRHPGQRGRHELSPDRGRERAAGDVDAAYEHRPQRSGVADPDGGRQVRRVPAEPGVGVVGRRAGLAGRGTTERGAGAGPSRDHLAQDRGGFAGFPALHHPLAHECVADDDVALTIGDPRDGDGARAAVVHHRARQPFAAGSERGVGRSHLERRDSLGESPERDGGVRPDAARDAHALRGCRDVVGSHHHRQVGIDGVVGFDGRVGQGDRTGVGVRVGAHPPGRHVLAQVDDLGLGDEDAAAARSRSRGRRLGRRS